MSHEKAIEAAWAAYGLNAGGGRDLYAMQQAIAAFLRAMVDPRCYGNFERDLLRLADNLEGKA